MQTQDAIGHLAQVTGTDVK